MSEITPMPTRAPIKSALKTFSLWYIIGTVVVAVIQFLLESGHSTGLTMGVLMGSAILGHNSFTQSAGRLPEGREPLRLAAWSTLIAALVSLVPLAAILWLGDFSLAQVLSEDGTTGADAANVFAIVLPIVLVIYFLALWLVYGPLGRFIFNQGQKSKS